MESEHVGPFNLGNPGEFTMLELAEVCLSLNLLVCKYILDSRGFFNGAPFI